MSQQLEVVKFRDLVPIQSVPRFVNAFGPEVEAIEIGGADFRYVDRVLINEVPSPEFIIVTKQKIYAQLPLNTAKISTIELISSRFTRDFKSSKLSFEIGDKTRAVEGLQKLLQLFVKWLLQSPGSDLFHPQRGGGLQELVGVITTSKDMGTVLAAVTRAIQNTVSQMRQAQNGIAALPPNERILSADVIDLDVFEAQMVARLRVSLQSVGGQRAVAEVGL